MTSPKPSDPEHETSSAEGSPTLSRPVQLPPDAPLELLIHDASPELLNAAASDPRLTEDLALALLQRRDLPREALEQLHKHKSVSGLRKVRLAMVTHPHAPRHVSVPAIRHLYVFELMQVALLPSVPADVKRAAEDLLLTRLAGVSSGERFTLAKRSSGRVAAALLLDKEERVLNAALNNPQMIEAWIVKALKAGVGTELLAPAVSRHAKWPHRIDVKIALLANNHTPFARVVQFAAELPLRSLRDLLRQGKLATNVKEYVKKVLEARAK